MPQQGWTAGPPPDTSAWKPGAPPATKADFSTSNERDAQGNPLVRFGTGVLENLLPSTTPSDYIEGPKYAVQHPMDAIGLILKALWDSHAAQASKTGEAAGRVMSEPTLGGKAGAASETIGHLMATLLPAVGPAAANAGEQIGSGDIAGGLGAAVGVLAPNVISGIPGSRGAKYVGEKLHTRAVDQYSQALNPTRKDTKVMTERIVPEALSRRVKATSLQKLEDLAEGKATKAGADVDAALTPHKNATSNTMDLVDELEKAKARYTGKTTTGATVVNDPQRVGAIQKLQDKLMDYGNDISVESMVQLRRNWDEIVNAGKGFTTPKAGVKAGAARSGRTVLRDELAKAVPDLDKVNKEFSFWQSLEDVTHASNERKTGQKRNLATTIAGAGGAVAAEIVAPGSGVIKGGLQAALGAQLFSSVRKLLDSPGYQMWSAVQKEKLADALMDNNATRVRGLVHQGLVSAGAGSRGAGRLQSGRQTPKAAENQDESGFDAWYAQMAKRYDLSPDPDSPEQMYDYRAAFKAGAKPDESDHWPSQFKRKGHPNEIVGGFNTRTGEPEPGHEQITDVQKLVEMGWEPASAKTMVAKFLKDRGSKAQSLAQGSRQ